MSKYISYINTAIKILSGYDGSKPFGFHIKQFFSAHKKYGSKDRRSITEVCYQWFRVARLFNNEISEDNLHSAIFLCNHHSTLLLEHVSLSLNERVGMNAFEKLALLNKEPMQLFPFVDELGDDINAEEMAISFLSQPDLFLRARPGREAVVVTKLNNAGIVFEKKGADCLALPNASKLDNVLEINKEAVIQDQSSQKVFDHLPGYLLNGNHLKAWDCCAASGGKSILMYDRYKGNIKLTLSDIRKSILYNCIERLKAASVPVQHQFAADLSTKLNIGLSEDFDIIICDAPCTGSGTWGRTPEQLAFFNAATISTFATLQKSIVHNVMPYLKPGGIFVYITCSVFKKENEEVVESIANNKADPVLLISAHYIKGYHDKADTMYVALFKKG